MEACQIQGSQEAAYHFRLHPQMDAGGGAIVRSQPKTLRKTRSKSLHEVHQNVRLGLCFQIVKNDKKFQIKRSQPTLARFRPLRQRQSAANRLQNGHPSQGEIPAAARVVRPALLIENQEDAQHTQ